MNTHRFLWAATTMLCALVGALLGFLLGGLYGRMDLVKASGAHTFVVPVLTIGLGVVAARLGSFLADRLIGPALRGLGQLSLADRILGVVGALTGLAFGVLLTLPLPNDPVYLAIKFGVMAMCAALGMTLFGGMRQEMLRVFPALEVATETGVLAPGARPKFLDTNVIIDGRLADLCQTGFIDGPIFVPSFVLDEVQHIADSSDGIRRARGRRGLDVLNEMKELSVAHHKPGGEVEFVPIVHVLHEFPAAVGKINAVDSKLVALARERGGAIITNDFNLNKVAELQGVPVLNLNELAQALKPVVLPGEDMSITLVKEGKEAGQGVGYLDDGTMVVVSDGAHFLGQTLPVVISSVYHTVAGKMIFAELRDKDRLALDPSDASYPSERTERTAARSDQPARAGGGTRRKNRP